jgi:mannonate dehydratase
MSAPALQLGVSHQTPRTLTPARLRFLRQMGVEKVEVRIPSEASSYDDICRVRDTVQGGGLGLHEIMLADRYSCRPIALGLPESGAEINLFKRFIRDLGRAGVGIMTYAWHTGGAYATGRTETRGCSTRLFQLAEAQALPDAYERRYSHDELWDNYAAFIREILPVAEDHGVRLQLHPNDPPVDHQGVPRLFSSRVAFRRAMEIAGYSPHSGILFCVGCFAEMFGPEGSGEDVAGAIYEFGSRGHIFQVHFRNISSPMPDFHETFPDNGYLDMYRIMTALAEVGYDGMVVPDHVPQLGGETGDAGEAYILGYIRALIQAVSADRRRQAAS